MTSLTHQDALASVKAMERSNTQSHASSFSIRAALPKDNDKLIELARRCPMKGRLEMYMDRHPDFFATNRVQGETSHIYLAETAEGQVIGCAAFTEKRERRGDKDIRVLHIGDLRTDPALRRGKIAAQLVNVYLDLLRSGAYDHGIVEILEGNNAAAALNKLLTEEFALGVEGRMNFYQLIPYRSYRVPKTWHYRRATLSDLKDIVSLFEACYGDVPGAPRFTVEWLEKELSRDPSFTVHDLWLAMDSENHAVAMIGLWDQSSFRRAIATKFSKSIRHAVRFLAAIGLVVRIPPLPREGHALHYVFGRWPIAKPENVDALSGLLRFILNRVHRDRKHQFLSIGFHERDPLAAVLDGIPKVQEKIEIYTHWLKDSESFQEAKHGPDNKRFVDLSLI